MDEKPVDRMLGTLLNDRYRLDSRLGGGGLGEVYRAYDLLLDREVAIKILNQVSQERLGSAGRARLLQEARLAARLSHPNIVAIHDVGESGGVPFIVMELVDGATLHEQPPTALNEILAIAQGICGALEHAHAHGIIHRDLKPENILLARSGVAKLMDFGLARLATASRSSSEGMVIGTPYYLAPEQALSQPVDGRADLYALGVLLYELTTGQLPFTGDDPLTVIAQHLHKTPTPPRALQPDLPAELEGIILKLLSKEPAGRFSSAGELSRALAAVASNGLAGNRAPAPSAAHSSPTPASPVPAPPTAVLNNLPVQLSRFIGRAAEIESVKELLGAYRLVTLTGAGGSGKTRLALQAAASLLPDSPDGVWLVELAPLSGPDLVTPAVLAALGLAEQPGHPLMETLTQFLRPRRLLLVLDNCEHLVEACARLAGALLRACPGLRILATSREAIGITGETALYVPTLPAPDPRRLPPAGPEMVAALSGYESVQLFLDRARSVQPAFTLTPENAPAIAQICYRLDGIPLAIELAAARLRALTPEGIAARLDDRFNLLTVGSRTALPQHQTLRAAIDWSYDLLPPAERKMLARLSVFVNGWSLAAAEAICCGDGIEPAHILDLLTSLVNKSLVIADEQGPDTRYWMLETIRQYAHEKMEVGGNDDELHSRHLQFYLEMSEQAARSFRSAEQVTWLERLESEHDNLRAALGWAVRCRSVVPALRLAGSLTLFWYFRGFWSEGKEWLAKALALPAPEAEDMRLGQGQAAASPVPAESRRSYAAARARALYGAGWLADERGEEVRLYAEALSLCQEVGDEWGAAFCLRGLGAAAANKEDFERANELLQQSLDSFRRLADPWGTGLALFNQGWAAVYANDSGRARQAWQESQEQFRLSGDRWGLAVSVDSLGYLARLENDYGAATELSEQALHLFEELGDRAGIALSLLRLGAVAYRREEYHQAATFFEQGLALERERGYAWDGAFTLRMLGLVACYQGDFARSEQLIGQSLAMYRQIESRTGIGLTLSSLGFPALFKGEVSRARALFEESLEYLQDRSDRTFLAAAQAGLARVFLAEGDAPQAASLLAEAMQQHEELGEKYELAADRVLLGRALIAQGQLDAAESQLKECLRMRRKLGAKRAVAESCEALAELAVARGQAERAARLWGAAEALRAASGAPLPPLEQRLVESLAAQARARLPGQDFEAAWAAGRERALQNWEKLIGYALVEADG